MAKYCIVYGTSILQGFNKHYTKKTDTITYSHASIIHIAWRQDMVFDTSLSAKIWLILHSRICKAAEKITDLLDEKKLDKLIAKGKYKSKASCIVFPNNEEPYLCEFLICEYDEVNKCLKHP